MRWYSFIKRLAVAGSRRSLQDPFLTSPEARNQVACGALQKRAFQLRLCVCVLNCSGLRPLTTELFP